VEAQKRDTDGGIHGRFAAPQGQRIEGLAQLVMCCCVPNKPEAKLRIDDLLIPLLQPGAVSGMELLPIEWAN
jgi:hypothetical protein